MLNVLNEIKKLRNENELNINRKNSNRYRILISENDGTETAYYFSTPIYNINTGKIVDNQFHQKDGAVYLIGSNGEITFNNTVSLENSDGCCTLKLAYPVCRLSLNELSCGNDRIYPTVNGFMYEANLNADMSVSFELNVSNSLMAVRDNDRCISFMAEEFRPFVTISCIGSVKHGEVVAPSVIAYQRVNDSKYHITFTPSSSICNKLMFEINLYEPKLVQDTTVESARPQTNNAFGGMAFIGSTAEYGEQWLYLRPDISKFSNIYDKHIIKACIHLPKYNKSNVPLRAYGISLRFCSFGSNWENKKDTTALISDSYNNGKYQSIDITPFITDENKNIVYTDGIILKSEIKGNGFCATSTGDSYFAPQIYEVNFK